MLGNTISDPFNVEEGGTALGMGLLDIATVFGKEKRTIQKEGIFGNIKGVFKELSGQNYKGYEIHMGYTKENGQEETGSPASIYEGQNNVYGSYIHGLFDNGDIAYTIIKALAERKGAGTNSINKFNYKEYKERQYDMLADAIRDNTDMDSIYKCMGM